MPEFDVIPHIRHLKRPLKILITGANGYIGMRLISALATSGHHIVAAVRNKERLPNEITEMLENRLTIIEVDFQRPIEEQPQCPKDIHAAYYLIHSMGTGPGFDKRESTCADHFTRWIDETDCEQIIYLSGLLPQEGKLSQHLESRKRVHDILSTAYAPLTTLRASIIVGSGSASFEIIRDLAEKLPVMITPKWVRTRCQPIAIRNVIEYLTGVMDNENCIGKSFDIGGPEVLTYEDMLRRYARDRHLTRLIIPVPVLSSKLSSYWLSIMTATNYQLAKALVGSLHMETVCQEENIRSILPIDLIDYDEAINRAFSLIAQNRVPSTWYGALSSGRLSLRQIKNIQVPEYGVITDQQSCKLTASKDDVVHALWSLGGKRGWPSMNWAWSLRGFLDKLVGGIGVRRGRRSPTQLKPGDALDFWRVILADPLAGRLILYAEMKLPGEAWLEFSVLGDTLYQTATFRPRGVMGRLYWWSTLPFHYLIFPSMAKKLAAGWAQKNTIDKPLSDTVIPTNTQESTP
ncbi:Uncharacterized conserved protein YbjT, contains NAD(P)-binding and DUF2867 domains [Rubritalea squalenifaciens DSM 18772]|uniref:Uncharacterized conserved protein YbjT, contains NAD(P)-binding and DUF2867 domains n=1 Tax=Rubritalea squalenifaciens DSM 18772 TaxID=1123071 RepID=A0A1M6P1N4_9BACT|nr:SDR family oxidoreductase [Rubritalea squalenifaciens]SHK01828.1 Uncharacterized conserved protein YbjT, contains NAD(P)-binding and DUF2867 domains [Rubritalea squalenifaciens DSM 18772]